MNKVSIWFVLFLAATLSGCASMGNWRSDDDKVVESFQRGVISYRVDSGAVERMGKMKTLMKGLESYSEAGSKMRKQMLNILYRDADSNRDYVITKKESERALSQMRKDYESYLGDIVYKEE
jgi:hypothetical protein